MRIRVCAIVLMAVVGAMLIVACQPADTTKPTVKIVGPANDTAKVTVAATIKVYAKDDVDNNIAKVRFYVGTTLKDSSTTVVSDTATFTWTPAATDTPFVWLKANADDKASTPNASADDSLKVFVTP
jgi:hypothetical protein